LLDYYCFFGTFLLAIFFCWLLALAYPQGLINEETVTYWVIQKKFHWFSSNQLDWYRTIPFGALLGFCSHFDNPTNLVYWFNSMIFCLDIALTYILGRLLFKSYKLGLALALSTLLFEVAAMRVFYNNLDMSTDAQFGELIYLGVLLGLIAWMTRRSCVLLAGCAVLGLNAFIKPSGLSVWFVWIPFAVLFFMRQPGKRAQKFALFMASVILLMGPIVFWCLRNNAIYGYAKSSGVGGCLFLQGVLPLMTDKDRVFADPKTDADFHLAFKESMLDSTRRILPDENANFVRYGYYERTFFYGPVKTGAFHVLARLTNPNWQGAGYQDVTKQDPRHMFKMDAVAGRAALIIVRNHPLGYVRRVVREYIDMFSPLAMWTNPLYSFQSDPAVTYAFWDYARQGPRQKYPELYNGRLYPDGANSNIYVAKLLGVLHDNPLTTLLLTCYYASQFCLAHLMFLGAIVVLVLLRKHKFPFAHSESTAKVAAVVAIMFLTVATQFLLISSVHISKLRYQLAGDMLLHLMLVLTIIEAVRLMAPSLRSYLAPNQRDLLEPSAAVSMASRSPVQERIADIVSFGGVFLLAVFTCWLVSLAYPEGLPHPSADLYWMNSMIYSLDCALVFLLARIIFASRPIALALAFSLVLFELANLRVIYINLNLNPDPLFAVVNFFSILIALIAWLKRRTWLLLTSSAIFGLLSSMKPAGMALWPVLLLFSVFYFFEKPGRIGYRIAGITLSLALLIGPTVFCSVSNYWPRGYAVTSSMGGSSLLQNVLPLMTDDERFFADAKTDTDFRLAVRQYEKDGWIDITRVLAPVVQPRWNKAGVQWLPEADSKYTLAMDRLAGQIAIRIIKDHPVKYLRLILNEYVDAYNSLVLGNKHSYRDQNDAANASNYWDENREASKQYLQLQDGASNNNSVALVLANIHDSPLISAPLTFYYTCKFVLSHSIFIGAVIVLFLVHKNSSMFANASQARRIAIVIVVLFLTAAANAILIAVCKTARIGFQNAGELQLHLILLMSMLIAARVAISRMSATPTLQYSND
jgi:hypothetical protein